MFFFSSVKVNIIKVNINCEIILNIIDQILNWV